MVLVALLCAVLIVLLLMRAGPGHDQRAEPHSSRRDSHSDRQRAEHRGQSRREDERGGNSSGTEACSAEGTTCTSEYLFTWQAPADASCAAIVRAGELFPDARCTPGGINPSVTAEILRDPAWRTRCLRNCQTSEAEKHIVYRWYAIRKPRENSGENQVCELDHLVPLELGGADGLGNIWPECGPDNASLRQRNFKIKDRVENYLADEVRAGRMPLRAAQRGIAQDWSQYLDAANISCSATGRC